MLANTLCLCVCLHKWPTWPPPLSSAALLQGPLSVVKPCCLLRVLPCCQSKCFCSTAVLPSTGPQPKRPIQACRGRLSTGFTQPLSLQAAFCHLIFNFIFNVKLAVLLQTPKLGGRGGRLRPSRPAAEDAPSRGQPPPSPAGLDFVQHALDATPPLDADKVCRLPDVVVGQTPGCMSEVAPSCQFHGQRPLVVAEPASREDLPALLSCDPAAQQAHSAAHALWSPHQDQHLLLQQIGVCCITPSWHSQTLADIGLLPSKASPLLGYTLAFGHTTADTLCLCQLG